MEPLQSALLGAALAFSLAVPPGPINAMMAAASVYSSRRATFIGFGAMTADAIFLSIVIFLHGSVPSFLKPPLSLVGGILIVYIAIGILTKQQTGREKKGGYTSGLLVGISNPYQLGWWVSGGLTMVSIFGYASVLGFFAALLAWVLTFPYLLNKLSERSKVLFPKLLKWLSAIALFIFGAYFLLNGLAYYLTTG